MFRDGLQITYQNILRVRNAILTSGRYGKQSKGGSMFGATRVRKKNHNKKRVFDQIKEKREKKSYLNK